MFKYALATPEGDLIGGYESMRADGQPGDEFIGHGNTTWRILRIVPRDPIGEFQDNPDQLELWEVEQL